MQSIYYYCFCSCILALSLSPAIIAAQVDDPLNWDLTSNIALESTNNLFDQGTTATGFDIFQPSSSDTSDFDINNVGFLDEGSNSMLFSNSPNDACFSSSFLDGTTARRRWRRGSDPELCGAGAGAGAGNSNLSIPSVEDLAVPGDFDKSNCK